MVRNEADIVEAFVRHNLGILDRLVVVDHGSQDETGSILQSLRREGLPLTVVVDRNPAFFQAERMTALSRKVFEEDRTDFLFLLDGDEFIHVESRARLEAALSSLPARAHGLARWVNYVPEDYDKPIGPGHLRWRRDFEKTTPGKVILSRAFLGTPAQYVVSGNHLVDDATTRTPPPHVRFRASELMIAHVPVRSLRQLQAKVAVGYAAHLATRPANDRQALHWRELYDEFRQKDLPSIARLREIACNYGLPREAWRGVDSIELVEDPVRTSFELRYTPVEGPDPLRLLMGFVEALLRPRTS